MAWSSSWRGDDHAYAHGPSRATRRRTRVQDEFSFGKNNDVRALFSAAHARSMTPPRRRRAWHGSCSGISGDWPRIQGQRRRLMKRLLIACVLSMAALGACKKQEQPEDTQRDVSKAQAQKQEDVAEAQAKAAKDRADAQHEVTAEQKSGDASGTADAQRDLQKTNADDQYKIDVEKADGDYKIAKEQCESMPAAQQSGCKDDAKAHYESAK